MNRAHFDRLTELLSKFPTIGERQAGRMAHYIIKEDPTYARTLADAVLKAREHTRKCPQCLCHHEQKEVHCPVCADTKRDPSKLTIVEKDVDVVAVERSGAYNGYYFVFGSLIPIRSPEYVNRTPLRQLLTRLTQNPIRDVTIAFSLHPDANHTTEVVGDAIHGLRKENLKVCVPGRGFSSGLELEYADPETIKYAFERRFDLT